MTAAERRLIHEGIVAVVCERGYRDTTVEAVCARVGLDPDAFGRNFADLEEAFCEIYDAEREKVLVAAATAFSAEPTWRDGIRASAYALVAYILENPVRSRIAFVEGLSAGERAQMIREQGMQALFELIDLGRHELDDPNSLSRATAEGIGGSIYNQLQLAVEREAVTYDLVPRLMYNVVLPYLGTEVAREELEIPPPKAVEGGRAVSGT